ncbi:5-(carboxyamino)imidazole ribonucleotide mutase [Anaerocolumna sp.]|uniref:5-(carboxyamino)imidazole ribonucleotide mutase n=1 Tax=Anaerocolumna sp. TaxID=2041569 RepID=UPI0028A8BDF8|nr:5-(carboxyamino)imidazole ribonucleotide mutase [Anaerocolumna sp.]
MKESEAIMAAKVGIIMGSDSDLPIMSKAAEILDLLKVEYDMTVISAHRMPDVFFDYAKSAEEKGYKVIIAGAGGAAHLPGMSAAIFPMPVIGVPIMTKALGGVDSLYSIVQMPSGIPVATVAINGGLNAGLLAAKILAVSDPDLLERIKAYAASLKDGVSAKVEKLEKIGYEAYMKEMN